MTPPDETLPTVAVEAPPRVPRRAADGERYQLGAEIARGGMGRVCEATDTRLGRVVAVKETLTADENVLRRFERETRITAMLEHPSIVPVHDAAETADGTPFYVMRKVSGERLTDIVVKAATLDERLALLPNVLAATQAVAHAHGRGVIHRDLKPSNILVGELGETVVIDWGLAKVLGDPDDDLGGPTPADSLQTRAGAVLGTPGYMAPEQIRGDAADARSDVYALGATLYFVLSQKTPHGALRGNEIMMLALEGPPEPLARIVPGVPRELTTMVDKALAHEPEARYLDAGGLAEDLRRFLAGQLVASHEYSRRERIARFVRRHRLPLAIGGAAAVVLAIVGAISVTRVIHARDRADAALRDSLERNDQLVIARAHALVASHPALAVALVKPLATAHWREARAIGMAARAAGVPRAMPASPHATSIEIARDGAHAVSAGDDGAIRAHDLATGASRVVAHFPDAMRVALAGDRTAVAWSEKKLATVDLATGSVVAVTAPTRISTVRATDEAAWLVGYDGSVWRLPRGASAAEHVAIADAIFLCEPSPDGTAIALAGMRSLWLLRDGRADEITQGQLVALAWSADGARLAAALGDRVVAVDPVTRAPTLERGYAGARSIAWHDARIVVGGEGRATFVDAGGARDVRIEGTVVKLVPVRDAVVAVTDEAFAVIQEHALVAIPPTSALDAIAAAGAYVVAGASNAILVWDLRTVLPRRLATGIDAVAVAGGALLAHSADGSRWIDPATGAARPSALPGGAIATNRAGDALVIERGAHALVAAHGTPGVRELDGAIALAAYVTDDTIAAATLDGEVRLYRTADLGYRTIARAPVRIATLAAQPGLVVAGLADGSALRYDVATDQALQLPAGDRDRRLVALPDGTVLASDREQVLAWGRDGGVAPYATLASPVHGPAGIAGDRALFGMANTGASLVAPGGRVAPVLPAGSHMLDWSIAGGFLLARDPAGRLAMTDLDAPGSWTFAHATGRFDRAVLAGDARRAFAVTGGALLAWDLELPATPEDTVAFLARLTNAEVSPGGDLVWP